MADPNQQRSRRSASTGVLRSVEAGGVLVIELEDGSTIHVRPDPDTHDENRWPPLLERKDRP